MSPSAALRRRAAAWGLALAVAGGAAGCGRTPVARGSPAASSRATATATTSPFAVRGVVEGFYGPAWTPTATRAVLAFLGREGMNTFVYAPKDDPYQRAEWRTPYPPAQLAQLRGDARAAARAGVSFVYSLSPGLSITYSSASDRAALESKLAQLRGAGISAFMLSFDDVPDHLQSPADARAYGGNLGTAQVSLANAVFAAGRSADPSFSLMFTPTEYWGMKADAYLEALRGLAPGIRIVWTGPGVISPQITLADARAFTAIVGRPPLLWYNYPVNDWTVPPAKLQSGLPNVQPRVMFLGPVQGLAPNLASGLSGVLANPMLEPYASELPLASLAAYLANPGSATAPGAAWHAELARLGGPRSAALGTFAAAESPYPAVTPGGRYVWGSTDPAADSLETRLLAAYAKNPKAALASAEAATLRSTFTSWVAASPELAPGRLPDAGLAADLAPWVTWMARDGQAGLDGLALLQAAASGSAAGPRALVQKDLVLLAAAPVQFGGNVSTFLTAVLAATP